MPSSLSLSAGRAAIKVIKAGMERPGSGRLLESERQARRQRTPPSPGYSMEGATSEGRPYFVMEYVAGVPITEHCDTNKLSTTATARTLHRRCARASNTLTRRPSSTGT